MKANWGTLYRRLMDGGSYSEKHVEKVKSQFQAADDEGRKALLKKYSTPAKKSGQNKAVEAEDVKESGESDAPAFSPPAKRSTSTRKVRVTRSGKKG
jgi:hypothetical protein